MLSCLHPCCWCAGVVEGSGQEGGLSIGPLQGRTALLGVFAVAAVMVAGGLALFRPRAAISSAVPAVVSTSRVSTTTTPATASRQVAASHSSNAPVLDLAGAEHVIRRWQVGMKALADAGLQHSCTSKLLRLR